MGGGSRYPYPKFVWSPAGGWWAQPASWKLNTFIVSCGLAVICGAVIRGVANREAELAGETLERRRLSAVFRDYLHKRSAKPIAAVAAATGSNSSETSSTS
ncbi:PALP domain-containing protein [Mycena kentingensis (nom. inval.)]|nr:PALP domain-containing protein [Mycena kentingensis (nom. inval.)]